MSELRQFLNRRRHEVGEQTKPLVERRTKLREELQEIEERLSVLRKEWNEIARAAEAIGETEIEEPKHNPTIKEAVLKVLEKAKRGMSAQEILAAINESYFDGKLQRTSLSPQLSRLNHDDRKITFDGTLWSLRSENKEGPAEAEPSFLD